MSIRCEQCDIECASTCPHTFGFGIAMSKSNALDVHWDGTPESAWEPFDREAEYSASELFHASFRVHQKEQPPQTRLDLIVLDARDTLRHTSMSLEQVVAHTTVLHIDRWLREECDHGEDSSHAYAEVISKEFLGKS